MKNYKIDIAVALCFFNRPNCLEQSFKSVKEARPSKLYLIQDAPRENRASDKINVIKCREIVEKIDWECNVVKIYASENMGCGRRIFTGLSEVFKHEEYAVIIEDDIVIGTTFLSFCKEMCERYISDERIQMISGMNHIGIYKQCPYSYFFSKGGGAIWGWATWRRCWNELQYSLDVASDEYVMNCLRYMQPKSYGYKQMYEKAINMHQNIARGKFPSYWSFHFGLYAYLSNRINIVPKSNLITNIGIGGEGAHTANSLSMLPKRLRTLFYAPIYELPEILKHPKYIIDDQIYKRMQDNILQPKILTKVWEFFYLSIKRLFKTKWFS